MTMISCDDDLNLALTTLTGTGTDTFDPATVREVAVLIWYSEQIPDLDALPLPARRDAGYVVERLARFNVVPRQRKRVLMQAVERVLNSDSRRPSTSPDPLARRWGSNANLLPYLSDLLALQTRHHARQRALDIA